MCMTIDLHLVPIFMCLYSIYLDMLSLGISLFTTCFARRFALSLHNLQYFSPLIQ